MKIWFRIGPDQGNEQDGPQPPERYRSTFTVSICEGGRFNWVRSLQARPPSRQTVPTAKIFREIPLAGFLTVQRDTRLASRTLSRGAHFSGISNRFWCENRNYRKQTIKPFLTGARTAIRDLRFLTLFIDSFAISDHRRWLRTRRFFQPGRTTSTRFWSKSRSYRKQMVKPLLPGATTTCRDLALRRMLLLPGEIATNELHRTHPE
jgi:hypothetical protein